MAKLTIKKMYKELINNDYVSKGENLSDAEIKKLYEQMIADEAAVKEEISMKENRTSTINPNTTIKEEISMETTVQKLINLANGYDRFTCYIENYKQEKEAEARNERIMKNFIETAATIGIDITESDFSYVITNTGTVYSSLTTEEAVNNMLQEKGFNLNKEDDSMKENIASVTNHNETEVKEETIMNTANTLAERILNMNRAERLMYVWDIILHVTKTSDELYIKKDELAQFLFDNDIISRSIGKNELKRTKRQELVDILDTAIQNLIKAKVITPINTAPVSVEELETIHNEPVKEVVKDNSNAKAKTDKLFALIKACAADNNKKGFGYTISSFMLQACILNAGAGVERFKGHTVTTEEAEMTKTVYHWLLNNNLIKPVVYSIKEDDKVRVYMPEYPGKTDTKNVKMIPYNKSAGYNAKKITSFLVCFK